MQQQLAHYQIQGLLGEGTFASVYRALDQKFERHVALKVLKPVWLNDSQAVARFEQEAKTMANLRHPHIVDVYDVGEAEGYIYLAQLLVEGETLRSRLERSPMSWDEQLAALRAIAAALDYAHGRGVVHRDVKPSNILLDQGGRTYLGDFGLVRAAEGSVALSTSSGGMIGTPAYMAPEQWEGKEISARTDIYALSCVVVEMLTGKVLFDGSTPAVVMKQHLMEGPKLPEEWPSGVPEGITEVLRRGLAENPVDRFGSAGELANALAGLSVSPPVDITIDEDEPTRPRFTPKPTTLWLVRDDGQSFELQPGSLTLGRSARCDIQVDDSQASRVHAVLKFDGQRCLIYDQNSANGTFVNQRWVGPEGHAFNPGDQLKIGETTFVLNSTAPEPVEEPAAGGEVEAEPPPKVEPPSPVTPPVSPPPAPRQRSSRLTATLVGCGLVLLVLVAGLVIGFIIWNNNQTGRVVVQKITPEKVVATAAAKPVVLETPVPDTGDTDQADKPNESGPTSGGEEITLNLNWGYPEPDSLDPALFYNPAATNVVNALFLRLTTFAEDGAVLPGLAYSWEPSDGGKTWTFYLDGDAKWVRYDPDTGEFVEVGPVTAHDMVYAVRRAVDPRLGAPYGYLLRFIENGEKVNTADPSDPELDQLIETVGVTAVDDSTVQFTLAWPTGFFPAIAGVPVMSPVPYALIDEKNQEWANPEYIVTNGPYALAEWAPGESIQLVKNPYYYDADNVQIDRIVGRFIADEEAVLAAYEAGELDVVEGIPGSELGRVQADPVLGAEYQRKTALTTFYYGFVNNKPPFDDVRIRRAFVAAIDRDTLVEELVNGATPARHFAPPGVFGAPPVDQVGLEYDPEMAKQLLAEAGYPNCEGLGEIQLMTNSSDLNIQISEVLQKMWQANLNCQVVVESKEWADYLSLLQKTTPLEQMPHLFRMSWIADYPDENNWMHDVFHSTWGINWPRRGCLDSTCQKVETLDFDDVTEQASVETDPVVRAELYWQAEKLLVEEEAAILPLYYGAANWLVRPYVSSWNYRPYGGQHFWEWTIDEEAR
ncbi:MAG: protein kinase [Anaerolineae bacterium]|nr:protein kinase [Anaerolineae bacterium]